MKPNYDNWIPKKIVFGLIALAAIVLAGALVFGATHLISIIAVKWVLTAVFGVLFILFILLSLWSVSAYRAFSYNGKRQLSKHIIEGLAQYVSVPDGSEILDVGCGSGALTIACAKVNPGSKIIGLDRWGKEYVYNKQLCEQNAEAEGVKNTSYISGDAVKLDFPDERFDAVTSNYVYHNIHGKNKQELILETLRVLKKGGLFAIHDLMPPQIYGDVNALAEELKKRGYQKVELIDTTKDVFMSPKEAKQLMLSGSTILYGIK